ncbi:hypothetical protein [Pedobacter sp. CFBP9032]|uniref:hypothetical protein n=1 Tax=Pedobacter sp. CFBP9032 TaxID=3096539 RepID=UPI002A6A17D7|nr:hypothetical protein [Pedobacter sp. CFBP9032]MDY0905612.1 hypothetical protein [Pedobacter sp. CFBP9032]
MNDQKRHNADLIFRYLWENYHNPEYQELYLIADKYDIDRDEADKVYTYLKSRKFVISPVKPLGNGTVLKLTDEGYAFMNDTNLMLELEEKNTAPGVQASSIINNFAGHGVNVGNNYSASVTNTHTTNEEKKENWVLKNLREVIIGVIIGIILIYAAYYIKTHYGIN